MATRKFNDREGSSVQLAEHEYNGVKVYMPEHWGRGFQNIFAEAGDFNWKKEDVFICNYPKSGTHWMWEIVSMLLAGNTDPVAISQRETMLERMDSLEHMKDAPEPRLFNSHVTQECIPKKVFDAGSKIIHIMRNPKDVAVSFYHYIRGIESFQYSGSFTGFMNLFMEGVYPGPVHQDWFTYELGWWNACHNNTNILFVTYEELQKDSFAGIKKVSEFLGKSYSDDFLNEVCEKCSFEVMKKVSADKEDTWRWVKGRGSIYRKGKVGDWKRHFTVSDNDLFDEVFQERMTKCPKLREKICFELGSE